MANEVEHLFICSRAVSNASDTSFPKSLLEKLYSFKHLQIVVVTLGIIFKMFANFQVKGYLVLIMNGMDPFSF